MNKLLINPYIVGSPVMGDNFYGRDKLLNQVERSLQSTNVVLLQGQRRIGKTSFLRQLAHSLSHEQLEVPKFPLRIPVIFDIQRYVQDTLPQFQMHLAGSITRALGLTHDKDLLIPSLAELETDSTLFQDKWLPQIYNHLHNQELVILVDEFDNFDEQTSSQAIKSLVSFIGQLVSGESWLKWVFTIGRLSGKISLEYDPILSSGEEFRLTFFSLEETSKLIAEPAKEILTYLPESIEYIYKLTNGQPHLTQAICSKIFEFLLDENQSIVTHESIDVAIPQTLDSYGSAISSIASTSPIEEKVLIAIAKLTSSDSFTTRNQVIDLLVDNGVRLNRDDLSNAIENLLEWELLKGSAESLQITVKFVQLWLLQNRLIEPTQQENLDIQYAIAKSRFDFAQQALQAGQYALAIKDYKESLDYIPNNIKALRGLAEAYRLSDDLVNRVETLKKLYLHDQNNLNELIEALDKFATRCVQGDDFSGAVQQYDFILGFQNCNYWLKRKLDALMNSFERKVTDAETFLVLYKNKKEHSRNSEIDNSDFFDAARYERVLEDSQSNLSLVQSATNSISFSPTENVNQHNKVDERYTEEELVYINNRRQKSIRRHQLLRNTIEISESRIKLELNNLNKLFIELNIIEQQIKDILQEDMEHLLVNKNSFDFLRHKSWLLSNRVQIEFAKLENDPQKAALIIRELDRAGEKLEEEDEDVLLLAVLNRFQKIGNSFKAMFVLLCVTVYLVFLNSIVKDWYKQAFVALITGGLIIAALIVPLILWGFTEGIFFLLRRGLLKIMKQFRVRILNLANSDLNI
jgi:GTPase SAR1 family protein